ncbi:MAG: ABC transporter ATP-binding protein [Alphaproteobacteria bacterium]|nr:ABC transporter ATP-binding protein [Alphaproteobacteria bacterium]
MVLSVSDLRKSYNGKAAVDGVSFRVAAHEVVGLLGPNGAGKTTTISMILGVLSPDGGAIAVDGIDLSADRSRALARANFAAVYATLPGNMTVLENLRVFGLLYDVRNLKARIAELTGVFDLAPFLHQKCGALSSGEQMRVNLAKAMLNNPRLLLLDEPTASLDPSVARETRDKIRAFAAENESGVLWTSHNMSEVEAVCDRVLFMSRGKILLEGDPRALPALHGKASLDDLFIAVAREPLTLEEA